MLVLYETSAGFALFKVKDDSKLSNPENVQDYLSSTASIISLVAFSKFESTAQAVDAASHLIDGRMNDDLKDFLKKNIVKKGLEKEELAVADAKLASHISKKFGLPVLTDARTMEIFRGIREQTATLLKGIKEEDMKSMTLGLSHSLSRHKIKFSPDKVDTMIVQAISLLDELDKELNTYCMRLKEWYGWHFPEMAKVITDNIKYAKIIFTCGLKENIIAQLDSLSEIVPEELMGQLKAAAEISMGTEISKEDLVNINHLAEQVINISQYRSELYDYLSNRMRAIAPNLTAMVGELVGARLISHSGSLMNLAKQPASTVQILGAEKALFRALKSKHDTPKYGLIYHASLVGQAPLKLKGKISRVLAAKTALAIRIDALSERTEAQEEGLVGELFRQKVEERLRQLENIGKSSNVPKSKFNFQNKQQKKVEIGHVDIPIHNESKDFDLKSVKKYEEKKQKEEKKELKRKNTEEDGKKEVKELKKSKKDKDEKKHKEGKKHKKEKKVESSSSESSSDSD